MEELVQLLQLLQDSIHRSTTTTMMKYLFVAAALFVASANAATRVAVIELGPAGTVHRSTSSHSETSAEGLVSFFSALHGGGGRRKLQHAGMTVVPDLFRKPDSGVVVSLSNVDLDAMPQIDSIMTNEGGENGVVGHMKCHGTQSKDILKKVDTEEVDASTLKPTVEAKAAESGMSGVNIEVTSENASEVDTQISTMVAEMQKSCHKSGKTVVLHLVVEEEAGSARRRLTSRRLEEEDGDKEEEDRDEGGEGNSNYYGYSYYNPNTGELVTVSKTMFQIQYFNVVLWTALGLVAVLFYSLTMMVNMPLMADTLLFGESAKVPIDD
eukprot:scaffold2012_cov193-Cylindrotheca_fusiformis.AAC.14